MKLLTLANLTTFADEAKKVFATKAEVTALEAAVVKTVKVNGEALSMTNNGVNVTVATGTTNGSVAVNGTDVAVAGLKALAFKDAIAAADLGTDVTESITNVTNDVATLKGEGDGSVKKTVADEIAKIVAGAPEEFDTLKELSDWIAGHGNDATALNALVNSNKTAIAHLYGQLGVATDAAAPAADKTVVARLAAAEAKLVENETAMQGVVKTSDIEVVDEATIRGLLSATVSPEGE